MGSWWDRDVIAAAKLPLGLCLLHHAVPGLILLIIGALTAVGGPGSLGWLCFAGVCVGIGMSLVLDEFALLLHLQDVYGNGEGQLSVGCAIKGKTAARYSGCSCRRLRGSARHDWPARSRSGPGAAITASGWTGP